MRFGFGASTGMDVPISQHRQRVVRNHCLKAEPCGLFDPTRAVNRPNKNVESCFAATFDEPSGNERPVQGYLVGITSAGTINKLALSRVGFAKTGCKECSRSDMRFVLLCVRKSVQIEALENKPLVLAAQLPAYRIDKLAEVRAVCF